MKLYVKNESRADRILRVALGIGLLALAVVPPYTLWGLVGIIPLATGLVGMCPLYAALGWTTLPADRQPGEGHA